VGDVVVVAEANTSVTGVLGTSALEDVTTTAGSNFEVTGVSATGTVDEDEVVLNNAIPTFSGVTATNSPGNVTVSTTTVIFNVANRNDRRTAYVDRDELRIAYVNQDEPRIVYVRAA